SSEGEPEGADELRRHPTLCVLAHGPPPPTLRHQVTTFLDRVHSIDSAVAIAVQPHAGNHRSSSTSTSPCFTRQLYRPEVSNYRHSRLGGELRVRLRMVSVADPAQQQASHGDVDHGLGHVDALLVVAH